MYLTRQGAPGGWVSSCGYSVVARFMTSSGGPPNAPTCAGLEPSTTGCRPALAMPASTAWTAAGGAFAATDATGTPHLPLIPWPKAAATGPATMAPEGDPPNAQHKP